MQVNLPATGSVGQPFAEKPQRFVKVFPFQIPKRPRATEHSKQFVGAPFSTRNFGDNLLSQHVDRTFGNRNGIQPPGTDRPNQSHTFDKFVTSQREQSPLGRLAQRVPRPTNPLQKSRDRSRRADLDDQINEPNIEPQLQRSGRDDSFQFATLKLLLGLQPNRR